MHVQSFPQAYSEGDITTIISWNTLQKRVYIYGDVVVGRCSWPAAAANALLMQNLRSEPDLNTQDLDKRDHHRTQNQSEHALAFSLMIYCFGDKSIMLELHECMKGTHVMNASWWLITNAQSFRSELLRLYFSKDIYCKKWQTCSFSRFIFGN